MVHLFVVCCDDRDGFQRHLEAHGVSSDIHYPTPHHLQPACANAVADGLAETERLAMEVVALPCFAEMKEEEIGAANSW